MKPQRLALALERLDAAQWKDFEDVAAVFLGSQYPNLRILASGTGDRGRDAVLWQPEDDPTVVVQFSVAQDWEDKIQRTAKRIKGEFEGVQVLIFVSPHEIGPAADSIAARLRKTYQLHLDVRDRTFFVVRVNSSPETAAAAEDLAARIVDPYLASAEVIDNKAHVLSTHESRAAIVYLALQLEDDVQEKGLTKVCFDGLVRATLRDTSPERLLPRSEIQRRISEVVPAEKPTEIHTYVDSALARLERRYIRYHKQSDSYCLTYDERKRLADRLADFELLDADLRHQIAEELREGAEALRVDIPAELDEIIVRCRRILECILVERGEAFVEALRTGTFRFVTLDEIREAVLGDLQSHGRDSEFKGDLIPLVAHAVQSVLFNPSSRVLAYLHLLANSYTLFSLVRATPNVQSALVKLFSNGEVWLDTTAVLRLLAETLLDPDERRFSKLIDAAKSAGISFFVTHGVLEELEAHTYRCLAYLSARTEWRSRVPYLYSVFALSGHDPTQFSTWIETFRGRARPIDDIAEYLADELRIQVRSLESEADSLPDEIRAAVGEIWNEIQDRRRARSDQIDPMMALKLARHDAENYLGVMARRGTAQDSPFGYRVWWLTLDHAAYRVHSLAQDRITMRIPSPPTLSPDFLSHYLSIGPVRRHLAKGTEHALPLMVDVGLLDVVSADVLAIATSVRRELEGRPERVVRRRIRDAMDAERLRQGALAAKGLGVLEEDLSVPKHDPGVG